MLLQCNMASHWLSSCTEWTLQFMIQAITSIYIYIYSSMACQEVLDHIHTTMIDNILCFNSQRLGKNGSQLSGDITIFKRIFRKDTFCILIQISFKFVPNGLHHNESALVQVMAWCLIGTKPLPEPMMTQLTFDINGLQWVLVTPYGDRDSGQHWLR